MDHVNFVLTRDVCESVSQGALVEQIYTIHGGGMEIYTIHGGGTEIYTIHGGEPEIYTIQGGVTGICIIRMPSAMPMGSIRSSLILSFENLHGAVLLLRGISAHILKVNIYSPHCSCKQGICAVALRVSIRLCMRGNGRVAFRYEVYP